MSGFECPTSLVAHHDGDGGEGVADQGEHRRKGMESAFGEMERGG
jgi:hypothetical protein